MPEVSCKIFEFFEVHADTYGYALEDLVAVTELPLETLQDRARYVPWADWAAVCERFSELVGGLDETERAGEAIIDMGFSDPTRNLSRALVRPEQVYDALFRWLVPVLFRSMDFACVRVSPGRLELRISQPTDGPVSMAWFRMAQGAFRRVPAVLGLDDAIVRLEVEGHTGVLEVTCPPSRSVVSQTRRRLEAFSGTSRMIDELGALTTDLRRAYKEVAASEKQLRAVLGAVPDPVAVVVDGAVVFRNTAWEELVDDGLARSLTEPRSEADEICTVDGLQLTAPPPTTLTWGGEEAALVLLRDVTAERTAEERRRLGDRLDSIRTVAAGVGHEINNPLGYALGALEEVRVRLLGRDPLDRGEVARQLAEVHEGLSRVRDISRDLQAFSRPSEERGPLDLRKPVRVARRLSGPSLPRGVRVDVDLPPEPLPTQGNSGELAQVFVNLLTNAAEAVSDLPLPRRRIRVRAGQDDDAVWVEVADDGPGVEPAQRPRVFEPFFSTKGDGGTGLGLAVCRQVIIDHGGHIELRDAPGAVFRVSLPAVAVPETATRARSTDVSLSDVQTLRVLAIDDEEMFARLLPRVLRPHRVDVVHSGREALARIEAGERWDVVLCDVMMPGMDGPAVHRRLLEVAPELAERTIFLTGGAFQPRAREYLESSGRPSLEKPYQRATLRALVVEVAGR